MRILGIVLFFVLAALFFTHSLDSVNQDIGRHLKSGELIWESQSVYQTNLFSFTEPEHPFINHHWLSEVAFFHLHRWAGLKGLIIFKTVILTAALALIWLAFPVKKTGVWLVSSLIGLLLLLSRADVRPEIFSYLYLAFFLFAFFRAKYRKQLRWLYFLPLIQILWTNSHIYFVVGPILFFFFLLDRWLAKDFNVRLIFLFLLTSLATLLNPSFLAGALLPLKILQNYGYTIVENQSTAFLKNYGLSLRAIALFEFSIALLLVSFVVALKNKRRQIFFESAAAVFFSVLAFKMIRNFGLYALIFIPVAALNWETLRPLSGKTARAWQISLITILALLIWLVPSNKLYQNMDYGKRFGLSIPAGAGPGVEFVKANGLKGPIFNNFDVGSFLIWKLYPVRTDGSSKDPTSNGTSPEFRVFVDGRPEAYSVDFLEKIYKPMQENPALWEKYSQQYGINYVFFDHHDITPWARSFLASLQKNPEWPLVYLDNSVVVFVKNTPANREVISKFAH